MNENKLVFQDFLRSRIHSYRSVHAFHKNIWQKPCVSHRGPILTRNMGNMVFQQ